MNTSTLTVIVPAVVHLGLHLLTLAACLVLLSRTRRPEAIAMAAGAALSVVAGVASSAGMIAMVNQKLTPQGYGVVASVIQVGFVIAGLAFSGGLLAFALRSGPSRS